MKIYTSNFANVAKIRKMNLVPIGIAIFPPRFYNGLSYKKLAPLKEMIHWEENKYIPKFNELLLNLKQDVILNELNNLSQGKDIVLLCYEKAGEFCHRRLVAKWLSDYTKEHIHELFQVQKNKELF